LSQQGGTTMVSFYLSVTVFILFVAYAGIENVMKLFAFLDLELRWHWIIFRSYFIRRDLEERLGFPKTSFIQHYKTYGK
jgi:hypothetical protein